MTKLDKVCNTLGTQGGVLAQYADEYIKVETCFGSWHKHCPEGYVLCYGKDLLTDEEVCRICTKEVYEEWRKKENFETTLFLLPKLESVPFKSLEAVLHDRY